MALIRARTVLRSGRSVPSLEHSLVYVANQVTQIRSSWLEIDLADCPFDDLLCFPRKNPAPCPSARSLWLECFDSAGGLVDIDKPVQRRPADTQFPGGVRHRRFWRPRLVILDKPSDRLITAANLRPARGPQYLSVGRRTLVHFGLESK